MSYDGVMMMLPPPPPTVWDAYKNWSENKRFNSEIEDIFLFFCLFACQDWWICPSPPPKKKPSKTMQRACFYQHITAWSLFSGKKSLNINNC